MISTDSPLWDQTLTTYSKYLKEIKEDTISLSVEYGCIWKHVFFGLLWLHYQHPNLWCLLSFSSFEEWLYSFISSPDKIQSFPFLLQSLSLIFPTPSSSFCQDKKSSCPTWKIHSFLLSPLYFSRRTKWISTLSLRFHQFPLTFLRQRILYSPFFYHLVLVVDIYPCPRKGGLVIINLTSSSPQKELVKWKEVIRNYSQMDNVMYTGH